MISAISNKIQAPRVAHYYQRWSSLPTWLDEQKILACHHHPHTAEARLFVMPGSDPASSPFVTHSWIQPSEYVGKNYKNAAAIQSRKDIQGHLWTGDTYNKTS